MDNVTPEVQPSGFEGVAEMFQAPVVEGSQPTTAQSEQPSQPQPEPQAQPQSNFEIRAGQTVYRSIEDAQRGIEHKDSLIAQLRSYAIQQTGVDPVTGQRIGQPQGQQHSQAAQPQATDYLQNPDKLFEDLQSAVQAGDKRAYAQAWDRLIEQKTQSMFGQYLPVIQEFARSQAMNETVQKVPEFNKFYGSQDYQKVLQENPVLWQGIYNAEQNTQMAGQLPELYRLAYQLHNARTLEQRLQQAQPATPTPSPNTQVRPTATPQQMSPAIQHSNTSNWRLDADARKALIAQYEQQHGFKGR